MIAAILSIIGVICAVFICGALVWGAICLLINLVYIIRDFLGL